VLDVVQVEHRIHPRVLHSLHVVEHRRKGLLQGEGLLDLGG
jgi:hypothetical protein